MNVDYRHMQVTSEALVAAFAGATTARCTDLVFSISGLDFLSEVLATARAGGNLPCGEVYCAPVEDGANGVLVADGTVGDIGAASEPVRCR